MTHVKTLDQIQKIKPHLLSFGVKIPFNKIFLNIRKSKNIDFVWLKTPKANQMAAVLIARLLGSKFVWIQNFTNPPTPNFWMRLLLGQADHIITVNQKDVARLIEMGIDKKKVKLQRPTTS